MEMEVPLVGSKPVVVVSKLLVFWVEDRVVVSPNVAVTVKNVREVAHL